MNPQLSNLGWTLFLGLLPYIVLMFTVTALMFVFKTMSASKKRGKLLDRQRDLETIRGMHWRDLENLVGEAYERKGFQVEVKGGLQADGGVDVVLRRPGQLILVQCKQWKSRQVGVAIVRELYGVMAAEKAVGGAVVTCGTFTRDAIAFAAKTAQDGREIQLVDGIALLQLVRDVQPPPPINADGSKGIRPPIPERKTESTDCPNCGSHMIVRTARTGKNAGRRFWGCSRYPACKGIRQI